MDKKRLEEDYLLDEEVSTILAISIEKIDTTISNDLREFIGKCFYPIDKKTREYHKWIMNREGYLLLCFYSKKDSHFLYSIIKEYILLRDNMNLLNKELVERMDLFLNKKIANQFQVIDDLDKGLILYEGQIYSMKDLITWLFNKENVKEITVKGNKIPSLIITCGFNLHKKINVYSSYKYPKYEKLGYNRNEIIFNSCKKFPTDECLVIIEEEEYVLDKEGEWFALRKKL